MKAAFFLRLFFKFSAQGPGHDYLDYVKTVHRLILPFHPSNFMFGRFIVSCTPAGTYFCIVHRKRALQLTQINKLYMETFIG
jgi:hypothetical protein